MSYRLFSISTILVVVMAFDLPTVVGAQPKMSPLVGQPAPDFTLTDLDGKTVKLSDFRGKKNVMLVFYRGWIGYW